MQSPQRSPEILIGLFAARRPLPTQSRRRQPPTAPDRGGTAVGLQAVSARKIERPTVGKAVPVPLGSSGPWARDRRRRGPGRD